MDLPGDTGDSGLSLCLSREEEFENAMTADGDLPQIVFTQKTGKTYRGSFEGYLYGYNIKPETKDCIDPEMVIVSREKLVSITITLSK